MGDYDGLVNRVETADENQMVQVPTVSSKLVMRLPIKQIQKLKIQKKIQK